MRICFGKFQIQQSYLKDCETYLKLVNLECAKEDFLAEVIVIFTHNKTYLQKVMKKVGKSGSCVILICIDVEKYSKLCYVSCIGQSDREKAVRAASRIPNTYSCGRTLLKQLTLLYMCLYTCIYVVIIQYTNICIVVYDIYCVF